MGAEIMYEERTTKSNDENKKRRSRVIKQKKLPSECDTCDSKKCNFLYVRVRARGIKWRGKAKGGEGKKRRQRRRKKGRIVKKEERKIKKRQTSKKMKSIQELTTGLGSTRQRKAAKQGEKNDKGGKKKVFSSQ